uniref:Uncharacterized protein n=1 Tax=Oryza nivara TaxID=4536 RepID=A0A0E0INI5_ORYNI
MKPLRHTKNTYHQEAVCWLGCSSKSSIIISSSSLGDPESVASSLAVRDSATDGGGGRWRGTSTATATATVRDAIIMSSRSQRQQ